MTAAERINYIREHLPSLLWGKWEIKEQISADNDSAVYRLESSRMNRIEESVLKIVLLTASRACFHQEQKLAQIAKQKEQAELESELLFKLQSCPNIVTYLDEELQELEIDGQFEGYSYLTRTEMLDCLIDCFRSRRTQRYECSEENVIRLGRELAYALQYAHGLGVLHTNIQLDKIYIAASGTAKLGGFHPPKRAGAIRAFADSDTYIAPEIFQAKHAAAFTPQADLYSLGICLYQLMNELYLPFEKECDADEAWEKRMHGDPFPIPKHASEAFAEVILKACAFSPADRFQSAEEMLGALLFAGNPAQPNDYIEEEEESVSAPAEAEAIAEPEPLPEPETQKKPQSAQKPSASAKKKSAAKTKAADAEQPAEPVQETAESAASNPAAPEEKSAAAPEPKDAAAAEQKTPQPEEQPAQSAVTTRISRVTRPALNAAIAASGEPDKNGFVIRGATLWAYRGKAADITVPMGVVVIAASAFENKKSIRTVNLPMGIMRIEERAFSGCSNLAEINFPESVRSINNEAFRDCTALESVSFHGVLSQLGVSAFSGCNNLAAVTFDCPIEKIGYDAFYACGKLAKIEISPYSDVYKTVDGVLFDTDGKHLVLYPPGKTDKEYTVPNAVLQINDSAFYGCSFLEKIRLSKNIKLIGSSAFRECTMLRDVNFPDSLETIKNCAFQGCLSLTKIRLPLWTVYIGAYAFSRCGQLQEIALPPKLTELGMGVFEYCTSLETVQLPESIVRIGEKAFYKSGLTELFVPYSATKIEKLAFAECKKLLAVFLSNRVNQIEENAFEECSSKLVIYGMKHSLAEEYSLRRRIKFEPMFSFSGGMRMLTRCHGAFRNISIPPEVTAIASRAFLDCKTLRSVILPSNVGQIDTEAFKNCVNLESISMTNLTASIGERAFEGCSALKECRLHDMSQNFPPKVQRKIHRNFYKALQNCRPESAAEYAKKYNVSEKSSIFFDLTGKQQQKENEAKIARISKELDESPFFEALYQTILKEMDRSERMLSQIEVFRDCVAVTGVISERETVRKIPFSELNTDIRVLPDSSHVYACAGLIVSTLGAPYTLAPFQNKESAIIQIAVL